MVALRCLLGAIAALFGMLLALPIAVFGLFFWIESFLVSEIAGLIEPRFLPWHEIIEFAPTVGWKPKANLNTYYLSNTGDGVFSIITDSQGWPGTASIVESKVVAFGDSFVFGYGVNSNTSFVELVPSLRIKAIGSPSYNMVQEFLWMQRLSSQLKGKWVIWFIYIGNDLYENLVPDMCGYRMPFVREVNGTGDWEIVTSHISPAKWYCTFELRTDRRDYYGKLAELCSSTPLSHRAYAACEYLIREGMDLCIHVGAQLMVMTIPTAEQLSLRGVQGLLTRGADVKTFDPHFPDRKISEICRSLGVPCVALKDHLNQHHYKVGDCHWNEKGHRQVAEVLSGLYNDCVLGKARVRT